MRQANELRSPSSRAWMSLREREGREEEKGTAARTRFRGEPKWRSRRPSGQPKRGRPGLNLTAFGLLHCNVDSCLIAELEPNPSQPILILVGLSLVTFHVRASSRDSYRQPYKLHARGMAFRQLSRRPFRCSSLKLRRHFQH